MAKPSMCGCAFPLLHRPLRKLAEHYFDKAGLLRREHFRTFEQVIEAFRAADLDAVIYSDVLEYLDRENEFAEGLELECQLLAKLQSGRHPLNGVLKKKLLPYQERGAIFAACRGRVVLADDMGLGKTVQALAAVEIEKFSDLTVQVIDGLLPRRRQLYASPQFYNLFQLRASPEGRALHARAGARPHHPG